MSDKIEIKVGQSMTGKDIPRDAEVHLVIRATDLRNGYVLDYIRHTLAPRVKPPTDEGKRR